MRNYRIVEANKVQMQIFNEAGPGFKEMASDLYNMDQGSERNSSKLSDKMLRLLTSWMIPSVPAVRGYSMALIVTPAK